MPPRGRPESLTRDEIVAATLRLLLREGLSRLTMRAVAAELGVTPMATYYYVRGKDDLIKLAYEEISSSMAPLRLEPGGWEAPLRRYLTSLWDELARYPGLGGYMIEQPSLGVTPAAVAEGIRFFEEAGFAPSKAPLAWSFAVTYILGRIIVDARLGHQHEAPRFGGLRAQSYLEFGIEAVICGLRELRDFDADVTVDGDGATSSW